jgi:predicted site-specific integrase-resolvase
MRKPQRTTKRTKQAKFGEPRALAEEMGVAYSSVIKWLNDDQIKGIRFGKAWRIPNEEYERVLKEGIQP